ncbi:putative isomerase [Lutibacter oricola]|uniref:Putative isomerase n=1 Tax=Lutibacter oricola TaxID=762486 RepID=A0A1H2SMC9_9FLAO|nr:trehalase family glycosidase [Lutibacter oricola]SDW32189.1 putative isomerase [Lutibacter oricola]
MKYKFSIIFALAVIFFFGNVNAQKKQSVEIPINKKFDTNSIILKTRLRELNKDIESYGILLDTVITNKKLLTGYRYEQFYDWDLYFENIYMSYYGISKYNFDNLEGFFAIQHPDGFIKRSFGSKNFGADHHFKPFIAQIIVLGSRQTGNWEWAKKYYEKTQLYLKHWFEYDTDKNGLAYWSGQQKGSWSGAADHSGMDNQNTRTLGLSEGVDLNCYLVRELEAMAVIAKKIGKKKDVKGYLEHAEKLKNLINEHLWDEKSGFYYDRNEENGKTTYVKSVSCFTPIWAGVASKEQVKRMVEEHLKNPKEFWTKFPVPGYALTEPDYRQNYQGQKGCNWKGSTWIPTNYMICHGLTDYGYKDLAKEIAHKTYNLVLNNKSTREFFNAETGEGLGMNPFFGWSSLAYYLPLELELNYNPMDLKEKNIQKLSEKIGVNFK